MVDAEPSPVPYRVRVNLRRAVACAPGLANPVKNHEQFLELIFAVGGRGFQRSYNRFLADAGGRTLLLDRPDIAAALTDEDALAQHPPGSLGHAYADFMAQNRLDAGLYDDTYHDLPAIARRLEWDDDFQYVVRRGIALHDLLHVLGGYGPDIGGEFGVIAFTHGQVGGRMTGGTVGLLMSLPLGVPRAERLRWWREGVARGKAAENLFTAPYEDLLERPLTEIRADLGILPDARAHPRGHLYSRYQFGTADARHLDEAYAPYRYDPDRIRKAS